MLSKILSVIKEIPRLFNGLGILDLGREERENKDAQMFSSHEE